MSLLTFSSMRIFISWFIAIEMLLQPVLTALPIDILARLHQVSLAVESSMAQGREATAYNPANASTAYANMPLPATNKSLVEVPASVYPMLAEALAQDNPAYY